MKWRTLWVPAPATAFLLGLCVAAALAIQVRHAPHVERGLVQPTPHGEAPASLASTSAADGAPQGMAAWLLFAEGALASALLALLLRQSAQARQTRESLRSSSEAATRLSMVARQTSNAVIITDLGLRIIWVNEGFTRLYGYTAEQAMGQSPGALLGSPRCPRQALETLRQSAQAGRGCRVEVVNRTAGGQELWVDTEVQPAFEADGVLVGFVEIATDISARKQAEADLRDSQSFLFNIARIAGVGGWEFDLSAQVFRLADQTCRILDLQLGCQPTLPEFMAYCNPSARPRLQQAIAECLSSAANWDIELPFTTADGRAIWVRAVAEAEFDDDGPVRIVGALRDITEYKQAEAALRASQAFLDRTGRIGGVGGWEIDLQTQGIRWTDHACRILDLEPGHDPAAGEGLETYACEARPTIRQAMAQCIAGAGGWDLELPFVTAKGRPIWVRTVGEAEFEDGKPVRLLGALQDITARHDMEADVQRSAQLLRGAIDVIDEAFVLFDPDDRLVFCNDKYRSLFAHLSDLIVPGARFEDIARRSAESGRYPAADGRIDEWVADRLAEHHAGNTTLLQKLDDGRSLRIVERKMPDGHLVGFRIDITDLVRATEAAEVASRAKSEFIATISHELRTPLQSVIGFSELGKHFAEGQPEFQEMFGDIHAGGHRMLTLVNALLDVSRIDSTAGSMHGVRVDLTEQARAVAEEMAPMAAERDVHLDLLEPASPVEAPADPTRLRQVLRNVLSNSVRYAPGGSHVEIRLENLAHAGVEIVVLDHGPGIPPDELETIFEPFVQSSRTRDGSGGVGLGLTICRKIMGAHGGSIVAANAPGGGTLMRIRLPA